MLLPSPEWLNSGNNAWQLAAATFVGLQSIPGLVVLYGEIVKKKWAINSAFMAMYAFAAVLLVWLLWAYNMAFGLQAEAAAFIIVVNVILTYIILKIISLIVPLRMDEKTLTIGDEAVHGEEAYAMD